MKIGAKTIKFYRSYWRQSPAEVERRLKKWTYSQHREGRSKMMAITEGKKEKLTRRYIDKVNKVKVSAGPVLMRLSYDLEKGGGTRESPSLIFEFQFFLNAGRADAEKWAEGATIQVIKDEALTVFRRIADKNKLSGDMQAWLAGESMLGSADRRYAEAERRDKNFIKLVDNRGTGEHRRLYVDY